MQEAAGSMLKIERAKVHTDELESELRGFRERSDQPRIEKRWNPHTSIVEWVVGSAPTPPASVSLIAGDVIHNLRAALDYLVHELVLANGMQPTRRTGFPLWETEHDLIENWPRGAVGLASDALDALRAVKPYASESPELWAVHRLDIIDKHRLILAAAETHLKVHVNVGALERAAGSQFPVEDRQVALEPAEHQVVAPGAVLFEWPSLGMNSSAAWTSRLEYR